MLPSHSQADGPRIAEKGHHSMSIVTGDSGMSYMKAKLGIPLLCFGVLPSHRLPQILLYMGNVGSTEFPFKTHRPDPVTYPWTKCCTHIS